MFSHAADLSTTLNSLGSSERLQFGAIPEFWELRGCSHLSDAGRTFCLIETAPPVVMPVGPLGFLTAVVDGNVSGRVPNKRVVRHLEADRFRRQSSMLLVLR